MEKRKIKFRAWDKFTKIMWQWEEHNSFDSDMAGSIRNWFEDSDLVQMQFTGMTDKNGKEIYEGDFIRTIAFGKERIRPMKYDEKTARFFTGRNDISNEPYIMYGQNYEIEVVGNVFENPELLENDIYNE